MTGATLDLTTSIVNLRRLADKFERGESIVLPRAAVIPPPVTAVPPAVTPAAEAPIAPAASLPAPPPAPPAPPAAAVPPAPPAPLVATFDVPVPAMDATSALTEDHLREDDLARLEQVRAEISDLSGRRLSPWTRRRLEEAQAAEREILQRLGFDSYLDLMLALASGGAQSEPALPLSSKLPSLGSALSVVAVPAPASPESEIGAGAAIDSGGSEEEAAASVHEIGDRFELEASDVVASSVAPAVASAVAEPELDDQPEVVDEPEPEPAGPVTIADWLRTSSFAGVRDALVDVNAGA